MTPVNRARARDRVIERLADATVVQRARIEETTEIYRDLRISGWDLWQFLDWVREEFGTDFSAMNVSKYAPGEGPGFSAGTFQSPSVGAILDAIARGAWTETS